VFPATEALLFDSDDERAVAKQRSRDVPMVRVNAEDMEAA
jgi:hypothetical protein